MKTKAVMKIVIGSIIVLIFASIVTWFLLSVLFKPLGNLVSKRTSKFKKNMKEKD